MSPAALLHGISPFGPIVGKELRVASRRKRNHLLRVAYLGALLLLMLLIYATTALPAVIATQGTGVAARIQLQAQLGQTFFATFSMFSVFCMALIPPVLTSTAVNSERLGKTLEVLLMTPITSWQIVSGKLFSRLLSCLMLLGLSLPVLAVVRLLGGVEVWQMMAVLGICTSLALSSAALGLFYSTILNRTYGVILLSYFTLGLVYFVLPVFMVLVLQFGRWRPGTSSWIGFAACNPWLNVVLLIEPSNPVGMTGGVQLWLPGILVQLSAAALLLALSAVVLRRQMRGIGARPIPAFPVILPPTITPDEADDLITVAPLPPGPPVVGNNPVLWREIRRPLVGRRWGYIASIIVVALLLISYGLFAGVRALTNRELQIAYAFGFNIVYWLIIAVLSGTVIAQEKESDTWTLLLSSALSARAIVLGKMFGIARRMLWPTALIALHFALFTLAGVLSTASLLLILWVILSFNSLWAATGVYLSLRLRTSTVAVIINLLIPVVIYGVVPIVLLILGMLIARDDEWATITAWYLPYTYLGHAAFELSSNSNWTRPDGTFYFLGHHLTHSNFYFLTLVIGLIYLTLAAGIVTAAIGSFDRLVGRAAQLRPITASNPPIF